jgi:hypothetical protein
MPAERKASIRELSTAAYELELDVVQGRVQRGGDAGRWTVDGDSLDEWMAKHDGEEVVLILASLADERPLAAKTCRTCGTDYTGASCPRCRAARTRLRGRSRR